MRPELASACEKELDGPTAQAWGPDQPAVGPALTCCLVLSFHICQMGMKQSTRPGSGLQIR